MAYQGLGFAGPGQPDPRRSVVRRLARGALERGRGAVEVVQALPAQAGAVALGSRGAALPRHRGSRGPGDERDPRGAEHPAVARPLGPRERGEHRVHVGPAIRRIGGEPAQEHPAQRGGDPPARRRR
jgi:hypothetical protein